MDTSEHLRVESSLDRDRIVEGLLRAFEETGSLREAARRVGLPRATAINHLAWAAMDFARRAKVAEARVAALRGEVKRAGDAAAKASLGSVLAEEFLTKPSGPVRVAPVRASSSSTPACWPVLMLSDWHYGETVSADEAGGVNSYSPAVARERIQRVLERAIDILRNHMGALEYEGIVCALLGDLVSGDIHDELTATNEGSVMEAALEARDLARDVVGALAAEFGRVIVPVCYGNHGRTTKKPWAKKAAAHNWDWLIGVGLARDFRGDERVQVICPAGGDVTVELFARRLRFSHGDRLGVKGGDGVIGALGPIVRGELKTALNALSLGQPYDMLLIGHFHQLLWLPRVIVNGSLKGHDEYAQSMRMTVQRPCQALFIMHPRYGVTARWEVYAT